MSPIALFYVPTARRERVVAGLGGRSTTTGALAVTIGMAPGTPHGRIRACLDGHAPALVAAYFEPDCGFAADTFDTVGENPPDKFAVGDLLALNLLDERLGPRAVRALLSSEGNREIGLIGIDPDARLGDEGDGEVLAEAHEVWNRLCRLDGVGPVKAGKLLARKRPRLVPIVDSVVIRVVGAGRGRYWSVFGEFMGDEANRNLLRTMRPESAVESDSAWDPRVLLTLETRMEHGNDEWCATSVAEVPGRAA